MTLTPEEKEIVDECIYLRGRIITAYSQVEFILADISVILDLRFPYLISKRIAAAKSIADRSGFETYREELHSVCDGLAAFDDIRVFMAHGWMSAEIDKQKNNILEFLRYERSGDGQFELMRGATDIVRLRQAAVDITEYCDKALRLFRKIYSEKGLENAQTKRRST